MRVRVRACARTAPIDTEFRFSSYSVQMRATRDLYIHGHCTFQYCEQNEGPAVGTAGTAGTAGGPSPLEVAIHLTELGHQTRYLHSAAPCGMRDYAAEWAPTLGCHAKSLVPVSQGSERVYSASPPRTCAFANNTISSPRASPICGRLRGRSTSWAGADAARDGSSSCLPRGACARCRDCSR